MLKSLVDVTYFIMLTTFLVFEYVAVYNQPKAVIDFYGSSG